MRLVHGQAYDDVEAPKFIELSRALVAARLSRYQSTKLFAALAVMHEQAPLRRHLRGLGKTIAAVGIQRAVVKGERDELIAVRSMLLLMLSCLAGSGSGSAVPP